MNTNGGVIMLNRKIIFITLVVLFCVILTACANVGKEEASEASRVRPYDGNESRETSYESSSSSEDASDSIIEGVVSKVSDAFGRD